MIDRVKAFFDRYLQPDSDDTTSIGHRLQLASAALLVELTHVDSVITQEEETHLRALLQSHYDLDEAETEDLVALAHEEKQAATDYYRFTSLLNQHYTQQQKIQLIEYLWRLAYADDELDMFEEHLIRRLADLLHVAHADFIQTKHKAMPG